MQKLYLFNQSDLFIHKSSNSDSVRFDSSIQEYKFSAIYITNPNYSSRNPAIVLKKLSFDPTPNKFSVFFEIFENAVRIQIRYEEKISCHIARDLRYAEHTLNEKLSDVQYEMVKSKLISHHVYFISENTERIKAHKIEREP